MCWPVSAHLTLCLLRHGACEILFILLWHLTFLNTKWAEVWCLRESGSDRCWRFSAREKRKTEEVEVGPETWDVQEQESKSSDSCSVNGAWLSLSSLCSTSLMETLCSFSYLYSIQISAGRLVLSLSLKTGHQLGLSRNIQPFLLNECVESRLQVF